MSKKKLFMVWMNEMCIKFIMKAVTEGIARKYVT